MYSLEKGATGCAVPVSYWRKTGKSKARLASISLGRLTMAVGVHRNGKYLGGAG